MIESNIQVKLDRFDGPLGLLLHLVQREDMNIKELDINRLTGQYLDYLNKLKDINFDIAGEYLYPFLSSKRVLHIRPNYNLNLYCCGFTFTLTHKLKEYLIIHKVKRLALRACNLLQCIFTLTSSLLQVINMLIHPLKSNESR